MRRVRITTKLNLLILAVPIVAALAFGVLMRMDRAESLSRLQQAALVRDAGDAAAQLRADLDAVRQDARFLSHLPPICGLLGARAQADSDALDNVAALYLRDRLASLFGAFLRSRPDYLDVRLIGMAAGGGDIVHVVRDGADVHVVMPGQRGDAAAPEDLQAIAALAPGQVHLSDIAPAPRYGDGAVAGPRILRAAVAIHDGQGALFGAIILTQDVGLRLDALQAAVDPAFQLYLVDAGGNALVLPDPAPGPGPAARDRHPLHRRPADAAGAPRHWQLPDRRVYELPITIGRGGDSETLRLLLALPAAAELALPATAAHDRMLLVSAVTGALLLLLAWWSYRRLTTPLRRLTLAARAVAGGDYAVSFPPAAEPDVRVLSDALAAMAARIEARETELRRLAAGLEDRVQARTRELKASEQQLIEQRGLLRSIIDNIGDGVVVADCDLDVLLINRNIEALLDPTWLSDPDEWARRCGLYHDEQATRRVEPDELPLRRAVKGEHTDQLDLYIRNERVPEGRWISCRGRPLLDAEGNLKGGIVAVHDIDARKQAEHNLRLIAGVFEHSREGIIITDADKRILRVNRAFEAISGFSAAACIGRTPAILSSGWHDQAFYDAMWAAVDRDGAWQGEVLDRRHDGGLQAHWLTVSAVCDETGRVTHYIGIVFDITERKVAEEHVARLAYFDSLTGLANRRLFQDRLSHGVEAARRAERALAVLFIDLDRFKPVNDTLGHKAGDLLLKQLAERFRGILRKADTLARLGGDEFGVVIEGGGRDAAARTARRLLHSLGEPFRIDGRDIVIGASIGISVMPDDGDAYETLLRHADLAMYRAKQAGGSYQFFSAEMTRGASERLAMEQALRRAIGGDELTLHYQPQVDLHTGAVCGVEALLRWRHPGLGLIGPNGFLQLAEETGLILDIGAWVLRRACRQRLCWRGRLDGKAAVAVNIAARQLGDGLPELVQRILAQTGLPARQLALEVSESLLAGSDGGPPVVLSELAALGVRLSVDDFGTGRSSLPCLQQLPLHTLKLDCSLVARLPAEPAAAGIVDMAVAMARSRGLRVLAEGVEIRAQCDFVRGRGCDEAQGFYFARPAPAAEIDAYLAARESQEAAIG